MIEIASDVVGRDIAYHTVPEPVFKILGLFNPAVKEANELLPRYRQDNTFDSTKFATRFPDFEVTTYRGGIAALLSA